MNKIDTAKLTYRRGVMGIVIDEEKNFLIAQLVDFKDNEWSFVGGGIEEGETAEEAMLRELEEEMGTDKFKILKKSHNPIQYEWPMEVIQRNLELKGKTFRGQIKDQYLVKFTGKKIDIKIDPVEIKKIKWVKYEDLKNHLIYPNQWINAEQTIKELLVR